ncbi:MAG TPA: NADH-quinone oxidoreductase subunit A [Sphingomicrobium sp.]|nr:NADH-quinone oxidoreductase subunit A [Sphingomicrobium sp.]
MASVAAGYLPILLFLIIALALSAGFVVLPMLVSRLTGTHKPDAEKLSEYECGFPAFDDSRAQFDVRFYLVAILFIVFDLEAAFLYPWAVSLVGTGWASWFAMMIFLVELGLGLAYAWKKGALEWE